MGQYADSALGLSQQINYNKGTANAYLAKGVSKWRSGDMIEGLILCEKSLKIAQTNKLKVTMADALNNIGLINNYQGNYPVALEYYHEALSIADSLKNNGLRAGIFINMGGIYYNRKNYDEALEYWKQTLDIYLELGNKAAAGSSMNNIGLVYADMGDLKKSLQYYFRSLSMYTDGKSCARIYPYENIGSLYSQLGMTDSASFYLTKALDEARVCKDPMVQIGSLTELANLFRNKKKYTKAEQFLKNAYQVGEEAGLKRETRIITKALSELSEEMGKTDESLRYFKQYAALGDSLYNDESSKEIGRLEAQYEFEKKQKDREIEQRLEEIEKERELTRQKWMTIAFSVAFLLMIVIAILIYRNYNRKKVAHEKLKALNAEISNQREALVSQSEELHRLNESLNGLNDNLEKKIEERTDELKTKNEELKNKNQKLAEYSFINAHKLRAPVASILGLIELFDNHHVTDPEKKEIITRIRYSTDDLNGVIKQIRNILEDEGFSED